MQEVAEVNKADFGRVHRQDEIHLFIPAENEKTTDAVVPLRWCICPDIFAKIRDNGWKNPHLLLVITRITHNGSGYEEVVRKIIPLEWEMEYISFPGSGHFKIQAAILCYKSGSTLRSWILGLDSNAILRGGGSIRNQIDEDSDPARQIGYGEINVQVAEEFFASKPPQWLWKWGNFFYETKPKDQCQFRRRLIMAFTLQPLLVPIWIILKCSFRFLAASVLKFGVGFRGIFFTPVIHPFSEDTNDVWSGLGQSVFLVDKDGNKRKTPIWFYMPVVVIFMTGTFYLFYLFLLNAPFAPFENLPPLALLVTALATTFFIATLANLYPYIRHIRRSRSDHMASQEEIDDKARKREWEDSRQRAEEKKKKKEAEMKKFEKVYAPLVCAGVPRKPELSALPPERRTIRLRFFALKQKVCKPFAR
jgi:hypothetical protein